MKTRRALLVQPHRFEIIETEINPGPGEVLVKVSVCGLCNWELNHWKGHLGTCPQTLGHEMGGEIVVLGEGVEKFVLGDYVTGFGTTMSGFADYVIMNAGDCVKVELGIKPIYLLGEPLKCVVTVLRGAAPECGDYGVVFGCGPMGLWCIQALSGSLLAGLIVVDIDEKKLELAKRFGATHCINPKNTDVATSIREITKGHMADFVIEGTGNPSVVNTAMACLRTGKGRLALMSSYEMEDAPFNLKMAMERSIEVRVLHNTCCVDQRDELRRAVECLNQGIFKMDGVITHVFRLNDIQKAFETLETKPADYMKGIVVP